MIRQVNAPALRMPPHGAPSSGGNVKRIAILALLAGALGATTACTSSDAPTKEDLDAVKRRLTSVEKRVKAVEGKGGAGQGKAGKAKGRAGGAKAKKKGGGKDKKGGGKAKKGGEPNAPTEDLGPVVSIDVEGDASKVVLMKARKKYAVPGQVPASGEYTVLAAFPDTKPMEAGRIEVGEADAVLSCDGEDKTCVLR